MTREIQAPGEHRGPALFLAGSITGAPDWQRDIIGMIGRGYAGDLTIFNPRRDHFDISREDEADRQIRWEFRHIRLADAISFWFAAETLAPIVLFEFGAHISSSPGRPIFVGVHPGYARRKDVEVQCALARPDVRVVYTLEDLAGQIVAWCAAGAAP